MRSIRGHLLKGLLIAGSVSAVVLSVLVIHEYDLLNDQSPPSAQALKEVLDHVIIPLVVFIALFGVGTVFAVKSVEKLLAQASKETQESALTAKVLQAPVDKMPDEIRPFVETINSLSAQIQEHTNRQEAFAEDAAHELKTPLAIMALELDKLPYSDSQQLRDQVHSLSSMVDQLLLLARSSTLAIPESDKTKLDFHRIGQQVAAELAPSAIQQGKTLSFESLSSTGAFGLEEAIVAALRTLVVNALRETPKGHNVCIQAGPGPSLSIIDAGKGLDENELQKYKTRGARADQSMASSTGLGLSIANRIVEAHGGELVTLFPVKTGVSIVLAQQ